MSPAFQQPDLGSAPQGPTGDERAFTLIVRAYEAPVFNYVLRMVGDRSLAEDLTQDVFLRVFQGLRGYSRRAQVSRPGSSRSPKNRVLDELRARGAPAASAGRRSTTRPSSR